MQKLSLKKVLLLLVVLLAAGGGAFGQAGADSLEGADSLFARKRYTESLRRYEAIFGQSARSSPAMLLRMAFIEEGSGNYAKALYYLNLHYNRRPDEAVIRKMDQLAAAHRLKGYENNDINYLLIFYERYYLYLASALLAFAGLLFWLLLAKKLRKERVPVRYGLGFLVYLTVAFALLNLPGHAPRAIVHHDHTYLMSAPSAGAHLLGIVEKGHRVKVIRQRDIWLEVEWDQQRAFVREQNVWPVE